MYRELIVEQIRSRVRIEGQGPKLLLLHGWGGSADSFAPVINQLSGQFTLLAVDFPGFGGSETPRAPYVLEQYAEWTKGVVEALGFEGCGVIAHSFGARVAIALSSGFPQLFSGMVLTGAAGLIPKRTAKYYLRVAPVKIFKLFEPLAPRTAQRIKNHIGSKDYRNLPEVMRRTLINVINEDLRGRLPKIFIPVFLFWGERDTETPLAFGRIMEKEMKNAALVSYPDVGHFAYLDKLDAFVAVCKSFFGRNT